MCFSGSQLQLKSRLLLVFVCVLGTRGERPAYLLLLNIEVTRLNVENTAESNAKSTLQICRICKASSRCTITSVFRAAPGQTRLVSF